MGNHATLTSPHAPSPAHLTLHGPADNPTRLNTIAHSQCSCASLRTWHTMCQQVWPIDRPRRVAKLSQATNTTKHMHTSVEQPRDLRRELTHAGVRAVTEVEHHLVQSDNHLGTRGRAAALAAVAEHVEQALKGAWGQAASGARAGALPDTIEQHANALV